MTNGNRITSTPPGSTPAAHPTPEGQWDAVASLGNPEYGPMEDQWEELRELADKMGQPLDENNRTGAEMIAKTNEAIVATESGPSVEERRRETIDYLIDNVLAAQEGDSDIDVDTVIQEFNKKSEGLWSREYIIDLAKRVHSFNPDEPFNEAESYRVALELGASIMPIVVENEDFYQNMLENVGSMSVSDIYQAMAEIEDGKEKFYQDIIESGRYKFTLKKDIFSLYDSVELESNEKAILDLRLLKGYGVCLLEGIDSTSLSPSGMRRDYFFDTTLIEDSQKTYDVTKALIENGIFDGKECTKAIEDVIGLDNKYRTRRLDFGVAKAMADSGTQPDSDNPDLRYWAKDLKESGGNMLKQAYDIIDHPEVAQSNLDFTSEAVMRLLCRQIITAYSPSPVSRLQSPRFREALRNPVFQDIILQTIDRAGKDPDIPFSNGPHNLFDMLLQDRGIVENMRNQGAFDNHPGCQRDDFIRRAASGELTEKERLEHFMRHSLSDECFDKFGNPTDLFFWTCRDIRQDGFYLDGVEKNRMKEYEGIYKQAYHFWVNGSKVFQEDGGPSFKKSVKYFNVDGINPEYLVAGLNCGDFDWQEGHLSPKVHPPGVDWSEYFDEASPKPKFWRTILYAEGGLQCIASLTVVKREEMELGETAEKLLSFNDEMRKRLGRNCWFINSQNTTEEILKLFDANGPTQSFWQASLDAKDFDLLTSQNEETIKKMGFDEVTEGFINSYPNLKNSKIIKGTESEKMREMIRNYFDANGPTQSFWQASLDAKDFDLLTSQNEETIKKMGFDEVTEGFINSYPNLKNSKIIKGTESEKMREMIRNYFDANGPTQSFWQASLDAKDFDLLTSQDEETIKQMGFDETVSAFVSAYRIIRQSGNVPPQFVQEQPLDRIDEPTIAFLEGYGGKVFSGEERTINESNIIQALTRFITMDAIDWGNSSEDDNMIKEAFGSNSVKDLSLTKLRGLYEEYLNGGGDEPFPVSLRALSDYMHSKGGAGPLTQIEAFLDYAGALGDSLQNMDRNSDLGNELVVDIAAIEGTMQRYRWDNQEKSNFYATSAEIINASPELFKEFAQLFVDNLSKEEFKAFTGDIYPLYRAKLALLREYEDHSDGIGRGYTTIRYNPTDIDNLKNQLHDALLPFNCKEISIEKRRKGIERVKENIFSEISELFKTKFSIRPEAIPDELSEADARVVSDMTRYLGSLAGPNQQKKDTLGFYLALQLDKDKTTWEKLRSGDDVLPSNYLDIASGFNVGQAIELSRRNNPITPESTRIDAPERLADFRHALQNETVSMRLGNVQTVDLRLQNLIGNIEELTDPDLYPEGIDRQRVELLRSLPSQSDFNRTIGTIQQRMMGKDMPLTDEGQLIMGRVEQILKDNDLEVNTNNIKQYFQTDIKTIQAPFKILEIIDSYGVMDSIKELQAMLNPPDSVAQILEKLDETPKPQSGIMALGADLDYLENLMVKRANELTADESNTLGEYLNSIRKKLTELDGIYGKIIDNYDAMKKTGAHPNTINQIREIDKIISNEANHSVITTTCANDMTTIIENMRACLSCVTKGVNNDTNLTFGEGYKFYLYSRENASRNSSVADEIVYFVPSEDEGGANKRLSFVMDRVYGMKNNDIMMAHIETMLKKAHELKSEFPEVPISVILSDSSINSCSASVDAMELSRRIGSGDGFEDIRDKTVTLPESGFGDHYVEFGGVNARASGPVKVSGIEIVVNSTR